MRLHPLLLGLTWTTLLSPRGTSKKKCPLGSSFAPSLNPEGLNASQQADNLDILRRRRRSLTISSFVSAPGDGHLYLNGRLFDFRGFNTPTILEGGDFQCRDLAESIIGFGTPVTRTYPLRVANAMWQGGWISPASGQIVGWDEKSDDWRINEAKWVQIDRALDISRQYGVKLIMPIINQDYGTPETDFVGNFNDLIRHRYKISNYRAANLLVDFFTDRQMIEAYKKLITLFLNRVNTINGRRYGDDDTILAFETGNEMNWGDENRTTFRRPPPANWTIEIAQHLKSLAPEILVMDGSFSRTGDLGSEPAWQEEALQSSYVDLFSYHIYGDGDLALYEQLNNKVRAHGKTLIIGEHGFYSDVNAYKRAYQKFTCAGALLWSLRPHSDNGGFVTHSEGNNIYSYHVPGWKTQTSKDFDTQEWEVIHSTYDSSYNILGLEPPPKPVPGRPEPFLLTNGTHPGLSWKGVAWADHYEIFGGHFQEFMFNVVAKSTQDNVGSGGLFVPLNPEEPTHALKVIWRKPKPPESHVGWVDRKWCGFRLGRGCSKTHLQARTKRSIHDWSLQAGKAVVGGNGLYTVLPDMPAGSEKRSLKGAWYAVRGVNPDGVPGPRSEPIFLKAN